MFSKISESILISVRCKATCFWCEGTGKFKKPRDEEKYSEIFDRYDAPGTLSMGECRKRALEEVGYDLVKCKHCNGTGIQKD